MNVGDRIKFYRKEKKLNQTELANKSGISRNALSNYELNKRKPTIEVLKKIANALEINISYLVEDDIINKIIDELKIDSSSDSVISLLEERFSKIGDYDRQFVINFYEKLLDIFKPARNQNNFINTIDDKHSIKIEFDENISNTLANAVFKKFLEKDLLIIKKNPNNPLALIVEFKDVDDNTLNKLLSN